MNAEITASDPIDEMIGNDPVGKRSYGPPCTPQGSSPSSPTTHAADTAASEQTSSERHDGNATMNRSGRPTPLMVPGGQRFSCQCSTHETPR
jgi:hypothetical protein